jgi:hypothetical protein
MTNGKDSAEVIKFLTLFSKLKDWCERIAPRDE